MKNRLERIFMPLFYLIIACFLVFIPYFFWFTSLIEKAIQKGVDAIVPMFLVCIVCPTIVALILLYCTQVRFDTAKEEVAITYALKPYSFGEDVKEFFKHEWILLVWMFLANIASLILLLVPFFRSISLMAIVISPLYSFGVYMEDIFISLGLPTYSSGLAMYNPTLFGFALSYVIDVFLYGLFVLLYRKKWGIQWEKYKMEND